MTVPPPAPLPAVFFGHGSPMNALGGNRYADAWRAFGARVRPRAILVVSAHWYAAGTRVTASARPRTNHDFVSFKGPVTGLVYPAPGDVALAARVRALLDPVPVALDERWGFDHGAWSVLANAYPRADVPVVELCIDRTQPAAFHYALAQRLAPLRDEGVLIAGSGNAIHNIELMRGDWAGEPAGWQRRFNDDLLARLERGDHAALVAYERLGPDAQLAIPTPDHYLPLLYVLGVQRAGERPQILVDGDETGGLGMLSFALQ
jgi:4,5-DOPA dioxygenase extradiol